MNVGRRRSDHEKRARGIGNAIGYRIGGNRGGGFVGNVSTQGGVAVDRLGDSLSKLTAGNNSTRGISCGEIFHSHSTLLRIRSMQKRSRAMDAAAI